MLNNLRKRDRYEFYHVNQVQESKSEGIYALGQYIPMSVDKARRVIDQIRGHSYDESLMILELMPYRACYPILKLIYSAAANASHNKGFNKADLLITKAEVNKGTTMKKLKPRARGRSYMIKRSTCHITIVLKDMSFLKGFSQFVTEFSISNRQVFMDISNSYSRFGYLVLGLILIGEMDWGEEERS